MNVGIKGLIMFTYGSCKIPKLNEVLAPVFPESGSVVVVTSGGKYGILCGVMLTNAIS